MNKPNIIDVQRTPATLLEFITLTEVKAQTIITFTDDDTLLANLLKMATRHIENFCNISIQPYTVVLVADWVGEWELPYGPVVTITSVQTRVAPSGSGPASYQTAQTNWITDGTQYLTFSACAAGGFNPAVPFRGYFSWGPFASPYGAEGTNRYKITYTTGYAVDTLPTDLKQAILMQVCWLFENRGDVNASKYDWTPGVCEAAAKFADSYKRQSWL